MPRLLMSQTCSAWVPSEEVQPPLMVLVLDAFSRFTPFSRHATPRLSRPVPRTFDSSLKPRP